MKIALLSALALGFQLFLFLSAGTLLQRVLKRELSLTGSLLLGYFSVFSLFEIVCLTAELRLTSLTSLSFVTGILAFCLLAFGMIFGISRWKSYLLSIRERLSLHGWTFFLLLGALLLTLLFVLLYSDASSDSDYYVGQAATALFTDSIGRFDPTNGRALTVFKPRYAFSMYPYWSAVAAKCFHIPAIVESRSIMSVINALMSVLCLYRLGMALFFEVPGKGDDGKKRPEALASQRSALFCVIVLFLHVFSSTIYLPGIFLLTRSFEGKASIANIVIPSVLTIAVSLWRRRDESAFWELFLVNFAAVCFSASGMFSLALSLAAVFPLAFIRKKPSYLLGLFLGSLPVLLWAGAYVLASRGVFVMAAVTGR